MRVEKDEKMVELCCDCGFHYSGFSCFSCCCLPLIRHRYQLCNSYYQKKNLTAEVLKG